MCAATAKKYASKSASNPKNIVLASVAILAIIGAAAMLLMYLSPTPAPDPSTNVTTGATEEEQQEFKQQQERREKFEKKLAPAGA